MKTRLGQGLQNRSDVVVVRVDRMIFCMADEKVEQYRPDRQNDTLRLSVTNETCIVTLELT